MKQDSEALLTQPNPAPGDRDLTQALPLLLLGALLVWLLGWYWGTAAAIEATWSRSQTFQHGYLIVPLSAWLIWRRRRWLMQMPPAPVFWPLLLLALLGFMWLLADLAAAVVVRQYALVSMVPVVVAGVMGIRFAWALAFPLAFLAFAVPFGDFLIPPMMNFTADFTVAALRLTGIPVYREGMQFSLPSGNWSIVEACSGLRYLIAALTLGCLYAYLTYRRLQYRLIFIALSVVVPVIANGVRAYMIVMIGHLSNMRLAVGVDHLIYGWIFFGVVIMLLFWVGSFWRDDAEAEPAAHQSRATGRPPLAKLLVVTAASAAVMALWPSYAARLESLQNLPAVHLLAPDVAGWRRTDLPITRWQPHYLLPRARVDRVFEKGGQAVGLYIGFYNHQTEDIKLVSSANALTVSEERSWVTASEGRTSLAHDGVPIDVHQSILRGAETRLLAWHWFWVEGRHTASPYVVKLMQAKSRLLGYGDDSAVIILYTRTEDHPEAAEAVLREFARDAVPAIERSLRDASRD